MSATLSERNRWGVDLEITLPLIDSGQRQANISQARIALEQSRLGREQQRRQIIQQIRDATRRVHEAERQIDLRQAALEFAQRTYDVEQSRFELGLADSQQLLPSPRQFDAGPDQRPRRGHRLPAPAQKRAARHYGRAQRASALVSQAKFKYKGGPSCSTQTWAALFSSANNARIKRLFVVF